MATAKTNLVIVESPAKAKTIGKYLGSDYKVTASMGHLRDLPKSVMGVDLENGFEPDYQPVKGREDTIKELKRAAKQLQKGGFARTVCTDDTVAVAGRKLQIDVLEQHLSAKLKGKIVDCNHVIA